ncbi:MAG: translation elongation factor Ts [Methyloligellaceae bacterium]
MSKITASMVKELRDKTGAGMMDCKTALNETNGDTDAAVDWLRTKGLAKAAKKAGRVAAEGLIGITTDTNSGAIVEVNSETDFVARNDQFQDLVRSIASVAQQGGGDVDKLAGLPFPGSDKSVGDYLTEMIGTIGENMSLRRTAQVGVSEGVVSAYMHNSISENVGKIGVLVGLESSGDKEKLAALGKQVAMHIAASRPLSVSSDELDQDIVERERAVLTEQARESGKPENIIEKMVEGRLRKFFEEVVLLSQTFVIDGENSVEKAIKVAESDVGAPIKVTEFIRFELGEGIERKEEDFAAEVAAAASS